MSSPVTSVRKKLTDAEVTLAFIIGGGITLIILGYALAAAQSATPNFDPSTLNILMIVGAALVVTGFFAWLIITRPWTNFDNWSTPLYTGHEHEHHGDDLTHIDGITDKVVAVLNAVGINTFADLASRNASDLGRIVRDAGVRIRSNPENWIAQAKMIQAQPASSHDATHDANHSATTSTATSTSVGGHH